MKKSTIVSAMGLVAALSGCASSMPVSQVPAQVIDGSCIKAQYGNAGPRTFDPMACNGIVVRDVQGNTVEMDLITFATPGDWVVLRCWDEAGKKECASRAEKVDNMKRLAKLKSEGRTLATSAKD